ncbi:cobalt-precorrin-8 methylmutase [Listeria innocua]|uniref:Cobalt-precorrin-8X methylmutase n=1 Tax=Listeria innocua ATCC 33091 TaxID=1002366 RepID=A0AB72Z8Z3_LISIO|nr:cobalt-precorrin-8 methylmutase [Listeria innocua]EAD5681491.1 cobalt-precorrin-8 methylmutase [Listeria innocua]EAF5651131.1 cobalt-precorrin-8 methylmutase [Listeria innocua]EAG8537947.1 cobalt-precorrin-8 methylmutase [Listeria innocua]EDO1153957.1 cobalt-precorrin-8 methylmutase [Listeria innocua]EED2357864.1 cobalt-precorrin-8 methylmutase [Listeria innocua]
MNYIKNPAKIEEKSFEIIQQIIDDIRPDYTFQNKLEEAIIKRAIHTTADFDYLDSLVFQQDVIQKIIHVLKNKGTIFTDTNMALSGINKRLLDELGCSYHCYVSDPETIEIAKQHGITRSMAGIKLASLKDGPKIFVLGNAPTAVYKIIEMTGSGQLHADAVVAVPVGFVGAAECKEEILETDIPAIVARGRKGGSNLAAAIINAILITM